MKKFLFLLLSSISFFVSAQNSLKDDFSIYLDNDTAIINTYSSKTLYIIADSTPIYKNAKVKVIFPRFFGDYAWDNMLWIIIPPNLRAGYLQAKSVSSGKRASINSVNLCYDEFLTTSSSFFDYKFAHENNQRIVTIEMLDTLPKGDTLQLVYGANGTGTYTYNSMVAHTDNFNVLLDNNNTGNFVALKDQPQIVFKHSVSKNINIVVASSSKPGKPALLKIMINDLGKNVTADFNGSVQLTCTDASAAFPTTINITPSDKGSKDVLVTLHQTGTFTFSAKVLSANFPLTGTFTSNPINVSNDSINIYWGDFHTHTKFSRDGFGSDGYDFARNGAGFDFYCGTDHMDFNQTDTFGVNRDEWESLKQEAIRVNQPNRFVSFLGYENSLDNPSGHYNFIFNFEDARVQNIPRLAKNPYWTIQNLWVKLNQLNQQGKMLTIPHHTGKLFGTSGADNGASQFGGSFMNNDYKRLIEIYSGHGLGEYYNPNHNLAYDKFGGRDTKYPCFAQDAWALGEKLGVIASTDSHNGTPSQTNVGLAAILSDSLNRDKLFSNLYNRHSYATTGERMILKFSIGAAIMGDEITVPCDSFPTINFTVNGTDVLDFIEVLKWDFKKGQYSAAPVHPLFPVIKRISFSNGEKNYSFAMIDVTMQDSCLYYVRVKQKNMVSNREVWAWTSPIWIDKQHCADPRATDSLYNFRLEPALPSVRVKWCMKNEFTTNYYVVERKNSAMADFLPIDTIATAHIAFKDSCYTFTDQYPDDTVLYYRIKMLSYFDDVSYSSVDTIRIPFLRDSVYNLNVSVLQDRIGVDWNANEFFAQNYRIQKRTAFSGFQNAASVNVSTPKRGNQYSINDFYPLKDTSYYRIIMSLPDGAYKLSNLDTIVFRIDSLIQFNVKSISNDTVQASWKGVHEQNIVRYELQRSQDRVTFFTLHNQPANGHLFDTAIYRYDDTMAIAGLNYYRVVLYLADGTVKISTIDSIVKIATGIHQSSSDKFEFKVLDNIIDESSSFLNFSLESNQYLDGTILITGADGNLYYQHDFHLNKGKNTDKLPIGGLNTGIYYLFFVTKDMILKSNFMIAFHGGCTH